jgi:hypothetical protein
MSDDFEDLVEESVRAEQRSNQSSDEEFCNLIKGTLKSLEWAFDRRISVGTVRELLKLADLNPAEDPANCVGLLSALGSQGWEFGADRRRAVPAKLTDATRRKLQELKKSSSKIVEVLRRIEAYRYEQTDPDDEAMWEQVAAVLNKLISVHGDLRVEYSRQIDEAELSPAGPLDVLENLLLAFKTDLVKALDLYADSSLNLPDSNRRYAALEREISGKRAASIFDTFAGENARSVDRQEFIVLVLEEFHGVAVDVKTVDRWVKEDEGICPDDSVSAHRSASVTIIEEFARRTRMTKEDGTRRWQFFASTETDSADSSDDGCI